MHLVPSETIQLLLEGKVEETKRDGLAAACIQHVTEVKRGLINHISIDITYITRPSMIYAHICTRIFRIRRYTYVRKMLKCCMYMNNGTYEIRTCILFEAEQIFLISSSAAVIHCVKFISKSIFLV